MWNSYAVYMKKIFKFIGFGIVGLIVLFVLEECIRLYINEYDLPFIVVDKSKCSKNDFLCSDDNNLYVDNYYSLGFTLKKHII